MSADRGRDISGNSQEVNEFENINSCIQIIANTISNHPAPIFAPLPSS